MTIAAKILADSISPAGHRLTTFEVTMPRIVLAEFNTHRMFSRNSASSRAIPVEKMLKRVQENPFIPFSWGKNQKGMQAEQELTEGEAEQASRIWVSASHHALERARLLQERGVHKQITNRLLEPFLFHTCIVSATEWSNFFNLRDNKKAAPEIQRPADLMHQLYLASKPTELKGARWHLPLVTDEEISMDADITAPWNEMTEAQWYKDWAEVSTGRCARVSYLTHDGKRDPQIDIQLHDNLLESGHMSPFEHPARPMTEEELSLFKQPVRKWSESEQRWQETGQYTHFLGNYNGWVQYRKMIPGEFDIHSYRDTKA